MHIKEKKKKKKCLLFGKRELGGTVEEKLEETSHIREFSPQNMPFQVSTYICQFNYKTDFYKSQAIMGCWVSGVGGMHV